MTAVPFSNHMTKGDEKGGEMAKRLRGSMSLKRALEKESKADLIKMVQKLQGEFTAFVSAQARGMKSAKPIWPTYTRKTSARGRGGYARIAMRTKKGRLKKSTSS